MRILSALAALTTSALALAQSPLTTTFANNNSNGVGGYVVFDLDVTDPAGLTIYKLDINTSSTSGSIAVYTTPTTYVGNFSNAAAWTQVASGTVTAAGIGQPSPVCLAPGFYLPQGQYGIALLQTACNQLYTTGNAPFPLTYSTSELTLTAGGGGNAPFGPSLSQPRVWNGSVYYNVGNVPAICAEKQTYGTGCYSSFASFYELSTATAFDLSNTCLTLTNTGNGYTVTPGGTYNAVGSLSTPTPLVLIDDSQVAAGSLGLSVGSNCWVALGTGNSNSFTVSTATMLGNPSTAWYSWKDLNPSAVGSGQVQYEESGTQAQITYDGVFRFGGSTAADAVNVQFQIDTATGNVTICWGAMTTLGSNVLVGYSPGGASANPGPTDISATPSFTTGLADVLPLTLNSNLPLVGGTWTLTAGNVDPISPGAVFFFGDSQINPGIDLASVGAAGCRAYTNANLAADLVLAAGPSIPYSVTIPANQSLAGGVLTVQATAASPLNLFGIATSNGLLATIGN